MPCAVRTERCAAHRIVSILNRGIGGVVAPRLTWDYSTKRKAEDISFLYLISPMPIAFLRRLRLKPFLRRF